MNYQHLRQLISEGRVVHLCGIGGVSMRALARMLQHMGASVQGSDRDHSPAVAQLRRQGISVHIGHSADCLGAAALVVRTAAVPDTNPEIEEARRRKLPVLERAQAWGLLMQGYRHAVCVAGTHGKTSATSMLTEALLCAHKDPTVMVGGDLPMIGGSLRIGSQDLIVAEACEYKNSFLSFFPTTAVLLNIGMDHLDLFKDEKDIVSSFHQFACLPPKDGLIVANGEDPLVEEAIAGCGRRTIRFGLGPEQDVHPQRIQCENGYYSFDIYCFDQLYCRASLKVPGEHNMKNALAAAAVCWDLGVPGTSFEAGLSGYAGVSRRFERKGTFQGAAVYDDYAHHPDEIAATLKTAKTMGYNRVICVFQPHTYSRTVSLFNEFARALSNADIAVLAEIFAARETNVFHISSKSLADKIPGAVFAPDFQEAAQFLRDHARPGDLIFTMGAGDIFKLFDYLHQPETPDGQEAKQG